MRKLILRAVGDHLLHRQVYEAARQPDGSYCFDSHFERVRPLLEAADISVINQETVFVYDRKRVSFFPSFGSPPEVGDAVINAGFTAVTMATNHALDKGYSGIRDSVRFWESSGKPIVYTGIHADQHDAETFRIIEKNGIRTAVLNYTATLNYHPRPPAHRRCVDVMSPRSKNRIIREISSARKKADVVAVFPHWGSEYLYEPSESQKKWARIFAEAGADLIIGTHPHVLQPVETLETCDGRRVPCFYSLGNFLACQVMQGTMLGGMADTLISCDDGQVRVEKAEIIPLVIHTDRNYTRFVTIPLAEYNDELAAENKLFTVMRARYGWKLDTGYLNRLFEDIMTGNAMEDSMFRSSRDVLWYNIRGISDSILGIDRKG